MNMQNFSIQATLAVLIWVLFGGLIVLWILRPPTGDQAQLTMLNALIMVVGTAALTVANFFFGSSKSSQNKDETLNRLASSNGPTP